MSRNECIIVPVHNVEHSLRKKALHLLDVVSELTADFQVRIVDDESVDGTYEVALELAKEFPQVRAARNPKQLGLIVAAELEIEKTPASRVFVLDISQPFGQSDFCRQWRLNTDDGGPASKPDQLDGQHGRIDPVHLGHGLQLVRRPRAASRNQDASHPAHQKPSPNFTAVPAQASDLLDRLGQILEPG